MAMPRNRCILVVPPGSPPAPLPIFGLHLAERPVLAFMRAGVGDFLIAGDTESTNRISDILDSGRCHDARVRVVGSRESLLPILERDEACFVARTDTLYDRRLVERFVEATRSTANTVAAVSASNVTAV